MIRWLRFYIGVGKVALPISQDSRILESREWWIIGILESRVFVDPGLKGIMAEELGKDWRGKKIIAFEVLWINELTA